MFRNCLRAGRMDESSIRQEKRGGESMPLIDFDADIHTYYDIYIHIYVCSSDAFPFSISEPNPPLFMYLFTGSSPGYLKENRAVIYPADILFAQPPILRPE